MPRNKYFEKEGCSKVLYSLNQVLSSVKLSVTQYWIGSRQASPASFGRKFWWIRACARPITSVAYFHRYYSIVSRYVSNASKVLYKTTFDAKTFHIYWSLTNIQNFSNGEKKLSALLFYTMPIINLNELMSLFSR